MATSEESQGFLPSEPPRHRAESVLVRVVATLGIIAVGTVLAAILDSAGVASWVMGVAVSTLSVVLAAVLWRSRTL